MVLLITVNIPYFDICSHFQPNNLFSTFSTIPSQIFFGLYDTPKGSPGYFIERKATLHTNKSVRKSIFLTSPTGTNSNFSKFTLRPKIASKHNKIALKAKFRKVQNMSFQNIVFFLKTKFFIFDFLVVFVK